MAYLHISKLFDITSYPTGETHQELRYIAEVQDGDVIEAPAHTFESLLYTVVADRILKRANIHVHWFVPYFPFARDDRRQTWRHGSELELAMELVEPLSITIADPHSDVSGQIKHIPQSVSVRCFRDMGAFKGNPLIVIPDAGATKKVHTWGFRSETLQCLKTRDTATGRLSGFKVLADELGGRDCIIVDDICDGGGTFWGLAVELKAKGAGSLTLAVTHGLFTKGTSELRSVFDEIYTFSNEEEQDLITASFETLYNAGEKI